VKKSAKSWEKLRKEVCFWVKKSESGRKRHEEIGTTDFHEFIATKKDKMQKRDKKTAKKVLYKHINSAIERINYQLKYGKCRVG